jgi:GR25 family glycosyltransferase involved in LPS biosynthesis
MNNPFDFFDYIYCIHLPHEVERKKYIQEQFTKVGITDRVKFIHAEPPPKNFTMNNMRRAPRGEFGVNLSQIKAVVHAIHDQAKTPLFFEDDIEFHPNTFNVLTEVFTELPNDWNVLYMGGHPRGKKKGKPPKIHSKNLIQVQMHSFADAYSIRGTTLVEFFDEWCNRIAQPNAMYDIILGDFIDKKKAFCVYPLLCRQRATKSAISGKYEDKNDLLRRAWKDNLGKNA